jgi:hypothetical protein
MPRNPRPRFFTASGLSYCAAQDMWQPLVVFYEPYRSTAGRRPGLPTAVARAPVLACLHAGLFRVGNILSPRLLKDRLRTVPLRTNQWC